MERKREKLPKTAFSLYVMLYCKRKNKHGNNLVEATKSWISLNENEKKKFIDKHKEFQNTYKKMFANYLKNAEPYLKRKNQKRVPVVQKQLELVKEDEFDNSLESMVSFQEYTEMKQEDCIRHCDTIVDNFNHSSDSQTEINACMYETQDQRTSNELPENNKIKLAEPAPPILKNGMELFGLLTTMHNDNNATWMSLSPAEKKQYQQAVLTIKKDYIKNYKTYLESLTPRELFDYYNKML